MEQYFKWHIRTRIIITVETDSIILQSNNLSVIHMIKEMASDNGLKVETPLDIPLKKEYFLTLTKTDGSMLKLEDVNSLIEKYISQREISESVHNVCTFAFIDDPQYLRLNEKNCIAYFW